MHDASQRVMGEVYFALCKTVDSPVSLGAWLRFKYAQAELASMPLDPMGYREGDKDRFHKDYSCVELLSKWKGLKTGIDTEAEAYRRFDIAEQMCAATNGRLKTMRATGQLDPYVASVFHAAQRKISRVLGDFSTFVFEHLCEWGPGATLELPRAVAFVDAKTVELPITVTRKMLPLARSYIELDRYWSGAILGTYAEGPFCLLENVFEVVDYNRIDTVPKSAKTDRMIAVEPRMNGFFQKGVGKYIRRRLKRYGIDLDDQTRNQRFAGMAHVLGLATVDLSMASDTVALELVYELLPFEWASFLDDLRSPYGQKPDGTRIRYSKFSSMGNGFTFELETLIFWALAQSITDQDANGSTVSVYGDDIIVSKTVVPQLIQVLDFAGFKTNVDKTHVEGLFFESCGKHYFNGVEVTPAYQKEELEHDWEAIRFGNRILRLAFRAGERRYLDTAFKPAWQALRRSQSHTAHLSLPFGVEGDDAWLVPYSQFPFEKSCPNRGVRCRVLREHHLTLPAFDDALYANSMRRSRTTAVHDDREVTSLETLSSNLLRALAAPPPSDPVDVRPKDPQGFFIGPSKRLKCDVEIPLEGRAKRHDNLIWFSVGSRWVVPTGEFSVSWR